MHPLKNAPIYYLWLALGGGGIPPKVANALDIKALDVESQTQLTCLTHSHPGAAPCAPCAPLLPQGAAQVGEETHGVWDAQAWVLQTP